jgi:predicted DNA-binding transcriptional regulator YafY
LAPTVLICPYPSGRLLSALRDAGYAPVVEDASGAAVLIRPRVRRAPPRRSTNTTRAYTDRRPKPAQLLGIVEELRRGDRQARALRRAPISVRTTGSDAGSHTQALAVLQQAMRERSRVWVGYVDAHGGNASRLVRPVSMAAGYLRAQDDRTDMLHTFALHRITAAVPES